MPTTESAQPKRATGTHFYRYKSCEHMEWLKPIILEHLLYVPLVSELNDPLDCKPKINLMSEDEMILFLRNDYLRRNSAPALHILRQRDETVRERLRTLGLEWFLQQMADILYRQMDEFRVFSMSKRFDNFSMWAKYAEGHKGFCLEFVNAGPFFGEHTLEVIYGDYPAFDMNDSKQRSAMFLVHKRQDWCNEEEVRLISKRGSSPYTKIQPDWLTRIILGKDMREEHRVQIREWARERDPNLTVVQARFDALRHELQLTTLP